VRDGLADHWAWMLGLGTGQVNAAAGGGDAAGEEVRVGAQYSVLSTQLVHFSF
jgi:hypothetical protein